MATIRKSISTKTDANGSSRILLRVSISKSKTIRIKTNVFVPIKRWDEAKERINIGKSIGFERAELVESDTRLKDLEAKILRLCEMYAPEVLTKEWMEEALSLCANIPAQRITSALVDGLFEQQRNPGKFVKQSFFDLMEEYVTTSKISEVRKGNIRVLMRDLQRYEHFVRLTDKSRRDFVLDVDTMDKEAINDFEDYLRNEYELSQELPKIFAKIPCVTDRQVPHKPKKRGHNTICLLLKKLRAFFNWCNENDKTTNRPFKGYSGMTEKYGTPYYITLEERNHIADFDLSEHPSLEVQRDIFIFQCCIGCRVSDLERLTPADIIDGEINYIPRKTKENDPITVKVPLNERASALVKKYKGVDDQGRLFPFIAQQNYNESIKEIFRKCGVDRMVTILNPTTGEEEKRPICEVASSHMARRCFVGNLYKKVKDPNLICPMSGHKVGSAAFARYREIDKETRAETIKLID